MGDATIRSVVAHLYDNLYVWSDVVINGLLESSQLDSVYDEYTAHVIYCNISTADPFAPILIKMIKNNEVTQIC